MTKLHPSLKKFNAILRSIVPTSEPDLIRVLAEKRSRKRNRKPKSEDADARNGQTPQRLPH
jgi:hypothetical protein